MMMTTGQSLHRTLAELPANFYCASSWEELQSKCIDGVSVPADAVPCYPTGENTSECDEDNDGQGCYPNACMGHSMDDIQSSLEGIGGIFDVMEAENQNNDVADDISLFYCGSPWLDKESRCRDGVPEGAQFCGDTKECNGARMCYDFSCVKNDQDDQDQSFDIPDFGSVLGNLFEEAEDLLVNQQQSNGSGTETEDGNVSSSPVATSIDTEQQPATETETASSSTPVSSPSNNTVDILPESEDGFSTEEEPDNASSTGVLGNSISESGVLLLAVCILAWAV